MNKIQNQKNNHLSGQTSPYLLQHIKNPVDWYAWGEEAFEKANKENKMIFLSIGYSTCHWCHVMAHESFESQKVAQILSKDYVAIKVDREERPDIDEVYMSVCQTLTGSGGWPLTIIMTPQKKPFFAGTYLPTHNYMNRVGLVELLIQVSSLWKNDRHKLIVQSETIVSHIRNTTKLKSTNYSSYETIIENTYRNLAEQFDSKYGGFSTQPKFPSPHNLLFLLRYYVNLKDTKVLNMVETTLKRMYEGGIFDHVGYGFSRYSTDNRWLVPHFEKMLYDNALLLMAYTEAYAITKNEIYKEVACKIVTFVTRDMQSPDGAFYSAFDADSEGIEGKYYVFSYSELQKILEPKEFEYLVTQYNVSESGNFEGENILNRIGITIEKGNIDKSVLNKLFEYRKNRMSPFLDKKILSSWNGLMIAALAYAGSVIDDNYTQKAERSAECILNNMIDGNFNIFTSFKDNNLTTIGFLPDYANFIWGLINLYSSTIETKYLDYAVKLSKKMIEKFWDASEHVFYMNESSNEELPLKPKDNYDGAMPSGSSVAIMNLVRLYYYTNNPQFKNVLDQVVKSTSISAQNMPTAYIHFVSAMQLFIHPHRQLIIVGDNQVALYHKLQKLYLPFTTIVLHNNDNKLSKLIPELHNYPVEENLKVYICEDFTCSNPINTEEELFQELSAN